MPATAAELEGLNLKPRELALDGGFFPLGVAEDLPGPTRVLIAGRRSAGSKRTNRRLARFRVGIEGRISHLKRRYGLKRSCPVSRIWDVLARWECGVGVMRSSGVAIDR